MELGDLKDLRDWSVAAERCFAKLLGVYDLQPAETTDPQFLELGKKYGIKFVTDDQLDCSDFSYQKATEQQYQRSKELIIAEFSLYPKEAISKTRIEQVIFCSNLIVSNKRAAGTLKVGLHYVDTLFIDLSQFGNELHGRRTIHHELYHAIDFRDTWHGYVDADWRRIQGEDFKYEFDAAAEMHRQLGENPQDAMPREFDDPYNRMSVKESPTPGFITDYARYSAAEDKAEIFCHLMVSYKKVMRRAATDAILDRKVKRLKEVLVQYIPEMDDKFWKKIAAIPSSQVG